ncbi:TnsA-like heteromeric transposase endonuclease subunit [Rhodococcus sp. HNM0563]|uniref:TnsA-like heteromeric transposase endonuclease subunit n=1 Tax=Rhodococcus sp. HNM0563 TaxID=2716339 RepID=UPI00146AD01B|nr:TnsA-like heteromeric transposase endonuclease subunit [Rhodococcus sp. HNM0563]NLU65465.1 TnsA-like heteromeric transposase endonuclease subunit [Rhodococcus sp. HNM0563]
MATLPSNQTDHTRVLVRLGGKVRNDLSSPHVSVLSIERALPIRQFFTWPGKRNYEGSWWSSTVRGHVVFESLLEREYLLSADFDDRIVSIAAQPLALLWPFGTRGHKSHVPDFFVRLSDGDGRLIDVRPQRYVEKAAAQFEMTQAICGEIGWEYEIFTGLPSTYSANLR